MKILITSDTHGNLNSFEKAVNKEKPFDMLFHCGDVCGDEDMIRYYAGSPCYLVAGNNDFWGGLPKFIKVKLDKHVIWMTHGHRYGVDFGLDKLYYKGLEEGADIILFGHTHRPVVEENEGVWLVNPGSLTYPRTRDQKRTYIVLNIDEAGKIAFELRSV